MEFEANSSLRKKYVEEASVKNSYSPGLLMRSLILTLLKNSLSEGMERTWCILHYKTKISSVSKLNNTSILKLQQKATF